MILSLRLTDRHTACGLLGCCAAILLTVMPGCSNGSKPAGMIPIQAHRGGGERVPENTLEAFEYAWKLGTIPEADVRTSRDNVLVAFHDTSFKRLVKDVPPELQSKKVSDLTWDELAKLDVGAWKGPQFAGQRIPQLREVYAVLRKHPDRELYVDVKEADVDAIAALAREFGVPRQLILASPDPEAVRRWLELLPESQTLHWMGGKPDDIQKRFAKLQSEGFPGITQLQIHVTVAKPGTEDPFVPSSAFLRSVAKELKQRGILFQVWAIKATEVSHYEALLARGVQSFATDHPEIAIEAARRHEVSQARGR
ncbi:MAG: hypothetical protein JXA69_05210 [Phycisphaerae bacterium]|nr:hypothetical protein [Phycisphaerae bacterium]